MFNKEKIIYIDPFKIDKNYNNSDIIMITHNHYDHYSEDDIQKVRKENTIIVVSTDLAEAVTEIGFDKQNILLVEPNKEYEVENIKIKTIPAYNVNKQFHPKSNNWIGYIIKIDGVRYYVAGDTDINQENKNVNCDVAFVPVRWYIYNEL